MLVPVSVLLIWVYIFVEMVCYISVGGATIGIGEVDGYWWKWKGLVVGDVSWCVLMPMAV